MGIRKAIGAVLATGMAAAGLLTAQAAVASADETPIIIGRAACEAVAKQYRDAGYSARCYNTHGERFYVDYEKPQTLPGGYRPSTGSA